MGQLLDIFAADKSADAMKDAAKDGAKASQYATDKTVGLQKEIFDKIWGGTQVQRDAGNAATTMMAKLMGLQLPAQGAAQPGQPSQPGQPQVLPAAPQGSPVLTGKQNPGNALAIRSGDFAPPTVLNETGGTYGGVQSGNYGQGGLTSGVTGQTQPLPGNALTPTAPATPATPEAPFDATAWLRSTPGYEMNFKEGARAVNAGLAASGRLQSGDAGREMTRYGQGYADRIYGDQFNRLASIAGAGQTATSQGAASGANYANQSGNALQNNAANLNSSYQNRANATAGFWGDMTGTFGSNAIARYAGSFMGGGF